MNVAVLYVSQAPDDRLAKVAKALARGIESQGHDVTVVDGRLENDIRLTRFDYIAVGTTAPSAFAGKVSDRVKTALKASGLVSGKRCYAFIDKKGLRKAKLLTSLMRSMESEGLYLKRSDVLGSPEEAEAVGRRLHIVKGQSA